jgi:hypothetical protein
MSITPLIPYIKLDPNSPLFKSRISDEEWDFLLELNKYNTMLPFGPGKVEEGTVFSYIGTNGNNGYVYYDDDLLLFNEGKHRGMWVVLYKFNHGHWEELDRYT